jgi:hypothetical protein
MSSNCVQMGNDVENGSSEFLKLFVISKLELRGDDVCVFSHITHTESENRFPFAGGRRGDLLSNKTYSCLFPLRD